MFKKRGTPDAGTPEKPRKVKKPFYKKWWFWVIAVILVCGFVGSGGSEQSEESNPASVTVTMPVTTPTEAPAVTEKEAAPATTVSASVPSTNAVPEETVPSTSVDSTVPSVSSIDFDVSFFNSFRNDATGKWRKSLVATGTEIQDYALDYYREYFKSNDEVHVIYNFSLNTVNILNVAGNLLTISVSDYVDGEEHDAKLAGGGTHLATYHIDIDTGEITYNSLEES